MVRKVGKRLEVRRAGKRKRGAGKRLEEQIKSEKKADKSKAEGEREKEIDITRERIRLGGNYV